MYIINHRYATVTRYQIYDAKEYRDYGRMPIGSVGGVKRPQYRPEKFYTKRAAAEYVIKTFITNTRSHPEDYFYMKNDCIFSFKRYGDRETSISAFQITGALISCTS